MLKQSLVRTWATLSTGDTVGTWYRGKRSCRPGSGPLPVSTRTSRSNSARNPRAPPNAQPLAAAAAAKVPTPNRRRRRRLRFPHPAIAAAGSGSVVVAASDPHQTRAFPRPRRSLFVRSPRRTKPPAFARSKSSTAGGAGSGASRSTPPPPTICLPLPNH